ncbi:MAG: hypothetical protein KGL26_06500 [Pseudomonadota bacterium]|nr:hypothetical protein [Alphaproteobacteria bacterium]MDE3115233.1 hypothetical protein [Pseudomonadota bacterium]
MTQDLPIIAASASFKARDIHSFAIRKTKDRNIDAHTAPCAGRMAHRRSLIVANLWPQFAVKNSRINPLAF